jgi:hypothetical protein
MKIEKIKKNYRRINLKKSCHKIYAKMMNEKFKKIFRNFFLDETQFGFVRG